MELDHLDQLKLLLHILKKMDSDFTCLNHQEYIMDIHVVLPVKEDKQRKLNSKKQISVNLTVNKLYSILLKCNTNILFL